MISVISILACLSVSCCGSSVSGDLSRGVSDTVSTTTDNTAGGEADYIFYDSDADDFD
jgi:hypothetical protein